VRIYRFGRDAGRPVERYGSQGVLFSPIVHGAEQASVGCMYLEPNGIIGRHEAAMDQLLLVVDGGATVSGAETQAVEVVPGCAVFWERGERHETRAGPGGLVAVVLEGRGYDPGCSMPVYGSGGEKGA
jgi:quercetin dioxygenase-like cupin family protein